MTGELFKVSIIATGVKKRCRKVERHHLSMGYIPYNNGTFDQAELENRARDFVSENMKSVVGKPEVSLNFIIREKDNFGTIEKWEMFSDKHKRFVIQTSLENELQ
jgi:hypothetical protein